MSSIRIDGQCREDTIFGSKQRYTFIKELHLHEDACVNYIILFCFVFFFKKKKIKKSTSITIVLEVSVFESIKMGKFQLFQCLHSAIHMH